MAPASYTMKPTILEQEQALENLYPGEVDVDRLKEALSRGEVTLDKEALEIPIEGARFQELAELESSNGANQQIDEEAPMDMSALEKSNSKYHDYHVSAEAIVDGLPEDWRDNDLILRRSVAPLSTHSASASASSASPLASPSVTPVGGPSKDDLKDIAASEKRIMDAVAQLQTSIREVEGHEKEIQRTIKEISEAEKKILKK